MSTGANDVLVNRSDWSLHRKGQQDQARHQEKVREVIRENLPNLISDESIIMTDGKAVIRIPIRSLDEHHFRFNKGKSQQAGQGTGNSAIGDVVARDAAPMGTVPRTNGAGDHPGLDYFEAEVSIDEIEESLFADLELPRLMGKSPETIERTDVQFRDVRRHGLQGNVDKKRTIMQTMKRNAMAHEPGIHHISPEDLRYKTWENVPVPQSQAVVLAMMDTSGSMGTFEKYIARTFFFWMVRFLRTQYEHVEIVFIAHHTEARIVSENEFFTKGESGGTICSSAYQLALDLIADRYPSDRYNVYPYHFSDGDNLSSDNDRCVRLVTQLLARCDVFGYGEVNAYSRGSTLITVYQQIIHPNFRQAVIQDKSEVYQALQTFFAPVLDHSGGAL